MSSYAYMTGKDENLKEVFVKLGVTEKNIFEDAQESGAAYRRMVQSLKKGDVVYIQSLDMLGMNMHEILNRWRGLVKDKGADVVVMTSPLLDTRIGKELSGSLVGDVVAEILSYAVNGERERQRVRQREGIERAKQKGIHCGRVAKPLPTNFTEVCGMWKRGEITGAEAGRRCDMPISTFRYHAEKD